ncbi:MAG: alanine-tRNA synthetase second additional domain-containing protein [Candidatus Faecousia sp.]|nr:alanine-tRNA synthetase second additional domain-containing protein [Clostridiales bacterium]MDD7651711.1 alanine-tRNA synthetase second additional domain-containing protein [Bacillota bacterium]MDY4219747.1 alanine-tRNA synthetase second additional domain-containing protein [Candidatus Faecousia sp.]
MSYSGRMQRSHILSTFYAPRGRNRIYDLGIQIAQMYLSPFDKLIGVIGDSGSGKSVLIRGMFPGLELTNDDNGVNVRPLPLLDQDSETGFFTPHTYHVDIRFEMGFSQPHALAEAIMRAVHRGKRVVVEHFDLIYPFLPTNANLLIGVGDEILVARPTPFGPFPENISARCLASLPYRLMAHTAEDLCEFCMPPEERDRAQHDDIHHGFILAFPGEPPELDLEELERKILDMIDQDLPVEYVDESHISIGGHLHPCTGPRTHVPSSGRVVGFHLMKRLLMDHFNKRYLLVGCVGEDSLEMMDRLARMGSDLNET